MPRAPRIEYEGAIYHLMARGDRREPIVYNDGDREVFVKTLAQACERAGWEVFAWVLLDNHYHLALRTPEPNLVDGMRWFQNAFTRRINTRNRLWGHLFGGRYKSVLVESDRDSGEEWESDYLTALVDYIHLNPARAGNVDGKEQSLRDYPWSSVARGYSLAPSKRALWLAIREGLDLFGEKDTVAGRKHFVDRLDEWSASENAKKAGLVEREGQSLQSTLRRGWYWGSESFREKLVQLQGSEIDRNGDRELRSSGLFKRHDEKGAEQIQSEAEKHFGETMESMRKPKYGDLRKVAIAWALAKQTTIRQSEIAHLTGLRSAANVSQRIRRFAGMEERELDREIREWRRKYSRFVN
ncbi:MAG: transposase [Verrucomicrobiales bacterium]|nr:transposase [Verrucomicrobiales bacterium]